MSVCTWARCIECVSSCISKKKSTWRVYVRHCDANLNTTHGCDYVWWSACVYTKALDGDSYVPSLYRDDDERRLNSNRWDNEWNDNNRFLCVRNLISLHNRKRSFRVCFLLLY